MTQYQTPFDQPTEPAKSSRALKIILIIVGLIFLLCFCCCGGLFLIGYMMPEGGVRTGANMEQYATDYISTNAILDPGETIVMYYDESVNMNSTQCIILTDQRLIQHTPAGTTDMQADEIIEVTQQDVILGTIITAKDIHGQYIAFEVFAMENAPLFLDVLEDKVEENLLNAEDESEESDAEVDSLTRVNRQIHCYS